MSELNPFSKLRILVADDDVFMAQLMKNILLGLGVLEIWVATSFKEAESYLGKMSFDVVILDWLKDPVTETLLVDRIRTSDKSKFPDVPIVLCTAFTEAIKVFQARDSGVSEIIIKPISPKQVMLKIFAAVFHNRPFVVSEEFVGPDRRRRNSEWDGIERRNPNKLTQEQIDEAMHQPEDANK